MLNLPKYYNIGWSKISDVFEEIPKEIYRGHYVGICGKTGQVCKMTSPKDLVTLLVVRDFFVKDGICEEGKRCINSHCDLNKTTPTTFGESYGWNQKFIKKAEAVNFPHNWDDLTKIEIVKPQE